MSLDAHLQQLIQQAIEPLVKELQDLKTQIKQKDYPPVLTVEEAAKILKCGKAAVYELAHNPSFPVIRDGRKVRIPSQALFNWINENTNKSA
jgi:excisionase family DNA binding protein